VSNDWIVLFGELLILLRLDWLGKQLEAMSANIRAELAPTEDRGREIILNGGESNGNKLKSGGNFLFFGESLLPR
jgi:hypothetical protein